MSFFYFFLFLLSSFHYRPWLLLLQSTALLSVGIPQPGWEQPGIAPCSYTFNSFLTSSNLTQQKRLVWIGSYIFERKHSSLFSLLLTASLSLEHPTPLHPPPTHLYRPYSGRVGRTWSTHTRNAPSTFLRIYNIHTINLF